MELQYLNDTQRKIYDLIKKKIALKEYNRLCIDERICPRCGSDINDMHECNKCLVRFSWCGKNIE